eukprot:768689-Prorocentrum_minimum.AAC.1
MYGASARSRVSLGKDTHLTASAELGSLAPLVAALHPNHPEVTTSDPRVTPLKQAARAQLTFHKVNSPAPTRPPT